MLRAAEWALRIDHPVSTKQATKHRRESPGRFKRSQSAVKVEFVVGIQSAQASHEFSPEHTAEDLLQVGRSCSQRESIESDRETSRRLEQCNGHGDDAVVADSRYAGC